MGLAPFGFRDPAGREGRILSRRLIVFCVMNAPSPIQTPCAAVLPLWAPSACLIMQATLISEVEIMSMLIPASANVENMRAATPGWLRMPTPTMETLATLSSDKTDCGAELLADGLENHEGAAEIGPGHGERNVVQAVLSRTTG